MNDNDIRIRRAVALAAARATAELVGWTIDPREAAFLAPAYRSCLMVPSAQALLAAFDPVAARMAVRAGRETRSNAVLFAVSPDEVVRCLVAVRRGALQPGYRLWASDPAVPFWLAPELDEEACFEVSSRPLRPAMRPPWFDPTERDQGFAFASAILARKMAGR